MRQDPPMRYSIFTCAAFSWNVEHERTLFAQQAQVLAAGQTATATPALAIDRLYQLHAPSGQPWA
jgi:hypothetical protein